MRQITARLAGFILIFGALLGSSLAVYGLLAVWRAETATAGTITGVIDLLDTTLTTTSEAMIMINTSVLQMKDNIGVIRLSLQNASGSMQSTANVTSSVASLIGDDFSNVVVETQQSLDSVQNSARMIDSTLSLISGIPFIGPSLGGGYRRDMPLETSIREVSKSLEPVPDSLKDVQSGLEQTSENFELMSSDLNELITTLDEIESGLANADAVMTDYQVLFARSQEQLQTARTAAPTLVRTILWLLSAFCAWLLIAQIALLLHGVELLLYNRAHISPRQYQLTDHHPG